MISSLTVSQNVDISKELIARLLRQTGDFGLIAPELGKSASNRLERPYP